MPRNIKPLRLLAIVCALLATVAVAACSSPAPAASTTPGTVASTTASEPIPQQLWGQWQARQSPTLIIVLAPQSFAFYPSGKHGVAWASGPDQITFGTTDACTTADTYVWKISDGALSFTGGDTDQCGRHADLIGNSWTKAISTSTS